MKRLKCYSAPEIVVMKIEGQLMQVVIASTAQGQTHEEEPDEDEGQFSRGANDTDDYIMSRRHSVWDE